MIGRAAFSIKAQVKSPKIAGNRWDGGAVLKFFRFRGTNQNLDADASAMAIPDCAVTGVSSMLIACLPNPILYCCFENVDVYVCQCFEFDAIPCHACFAEVPSKGLGQILLVLDSHNVDGNACCIGTNSDLVELSGFSIGIFNSLGSIPNVGVGNDLSFLVFAIQEPQR